MKKLVWIVLISTLFLTLGACGANSESDLPKDDETFGHDLTGIPRLPNSVRTGFQEDGTSTHVTYMTESNLNTIQIFFYTNLTALGWTFLQNAFVDDDLLMVACKGNYVFELIGFEMTVRQGYRFDMTLSSN